MAPCALGAFVVGGDVVGVRGWCVGVAGDGVTEELPGAASGELPVPPHPLTAASSAIAGAHRRQWVTPWTVVPAT